MIRVRDARILSISVLAAGALMTTTPSISHASSQDDAKAVAALDTEYQAAVKKNDAATMDRILADDFILVTGRGKVYNKTDLLKSARDKDAVYEHQEDTEQTVRVWGDTAVITALLWVSDTYVRTSGGWRYVFGQASLPLPKAP